MHRLLLWDWVHAEAGFRMLSMLKWVPALLLGASPGAYQCWVRIFSIPGAVWPQDRHRDSWTHTCKGTWLDLGWEWAALAKVNSRGPAPTDACCSPWKTASEREEEEEQKQTYLVRL